VLRTALQPPSAGAVQFVVYVGCTVFVWVLLSENLHLDGFRSGWRLPALVSHLLLAVGVLMVLLLAVGNVSERYVGKLTLSVFSLFLLIGFLGIRGFALRRVLQRYRTGQVHRVVILGSDRLATELAVKFTHHPELLCRVIGFLCPGADVPATAPNRATTAGPATVSTTDVIGLLRRHQVDELVMAHTPASSEILNLVALCRQHAIRVSLVPQPYELYLSRPSLLDLGGLPLLQLGEMPPASGGPANACWIWRWVRFSPWPRCPSFWPAPRLSAAPPDTAFVGKDASAGKARSFPCCGSTWITIREMVQVLSGCWSGSALPNCPNFGMCCAGK